MDETTEKLLLFSAVYLNITKIEPIKFIQILLVLFLENIK